VHCSNARRLWLGLRLSAEDHRRGIHDIAAAIEALPPTARQMADNITPYIVARLFGS
jgi:hypothetical protein